MFVCCFYFLLLGRPVLGLLCAANQYKHSAGTGARTCHADQDPSPLVPSPLSPSGPDLGSFHQRLITFRDYLPRLGNLLLSLAFWDHCQLVCNSTYFCDWYISHRNSSAILSSFNFIGPANSHSPPHKEIYLLALNSLLCILLWWGGRLEPFLSHSLNPTIE